MMTAIAPPQSGQRLALLIQYQGTHFHGWQRQVGQRTVQEVIEQAIASVVNHPVSVVAAGRTDTGVHAAGQVAHVTVNSPIPVHRWPGILNARLPADVVIRAAAVVPDHWHARFSALWRRYRYTLYTDPCPNIFLRPWTWHYYYAPLDVEKMAAVLQPLLGRHHLSAFHRSGSNRAHSWVEVQAVSCQRRGALVEIEVQASGFLYGMMRLLVGLLVQVGQGQRSPASFTEIWQQEQRHLVKYAAPPVGLCLLGVGYPESPFPLALCTEAMPQFQLASITPELSIA
ncbi:tRNA pseudouridine(38-40) synthase TruA [Thermosynechococcus sp. QKsg1]|uniref:tRNA pseudouridine(38-40) synthase TruA n=1 Tax=unclassified Thermosynechococcus TaxID=2622553 RepID=UPI00122E42FD|nr:MULTISPECIES: tRNA pseudouridine(38-40) synthase TruA [unclassified Thermosynechococcus]QEQ00357.1 tRNA pseudouridine(38-40) synthase TruA [Thermosynechococcus sp. CL-1]WJI29621.1 tRNA pseudouridine(38-40) synthase TruA [Thermosynechococcus sp. B3]WKT84207.1 tRNA pseudouridine(38-40) synthase TruA [Thermosynechococcus sp. HY596]WNC63341.1 tRNA pseudouridine(38-40) synthase TruA [Thermosynechococcus sp. HY591]WNC65901.1 tRNA pseudouridine(38-40) synthase TruA [Thermosynechococcus sp. HY593]